MSVSNKGQQTMYECQVCGHEKYVSEFTNPDAMSHVCDECYDENEADYYASMANEDEIAASDDAQP